MERMDYQGIKVMPETLRQIAHCEYSSLIDTFARDSDPNIMQHLLTYSLMRCGRSFERKRILQSTDDR